MEQDEPGLVMVGAWVPVEMKESLERIAKQEDRSVSRQLRRLIAEHLIEHGEEGTPK